MASKITITVNAGGVAGQTLELAPNIILTFSNSQGFAKVPISANINTQAFSIVTKFNNDFNGFGTYTTDLSNNVVEIIHPDDDFFANFVNSTSFLSVSVNNVTLETPPIAIPSVSKYDPAPCASVNFNLTFNNGNFEDLRIFWGNATQYSDSNNNTASVVVPRGVISVLYNWTFGGESYNNTFSIPDVFEILSVNVENSFFGSNATIEAVNIAGFEEFQVLSVSDIQNIPPPDENQWQFSKNFYNLVPGDYVAYAKDKFDCVKFELFEASANSDYLRAPFFNYVSPLNDFPFFLQAQPEQGANINQDNRLLHELPLRNQIRETYTHSIYSQGSGTIQFKSSADINEAYLLDCEDNEVPLNVVQKTDFINSDTVLEGIYESSLGLARIRFEPGDIYDSSGNVIGSHAYNNTLPLFYEIGTIINIENVGIGGIVSIEEIAGIRYANTDIVTATGGVAKIQSVHTVEKYEVYEFEYNASLVSGDRFSIAIRCKNQGGAENWWRTNPIEKISNDSLSYFSIIEYFALNYHEINYSFGIRHKRYVKWEHLPIPVTPDVEIETYKTDTKTVKIDKSGVRLYQFVFEALPNEIAISLVECINYSDAVIIDGKAYVSTETAELESVGFQKSRVKARLTADKRLSNPEDIGSSLVESFYPVVTE